MQFSAGFPETKQELVNALAITNAGNPNPFSVTLGQIRNHSLPVLLFYSGAELTVKTNCFFEWGIVNNWNPENRYKKIRITKLNCEKYIKAIKKIIKEIS